MSKFGSNATQNSWMLGLCPIPHMRIRGGGKIEPTQTFQKRVAKFKVAPLTRTLLDLRQWVGCTSLRGLRIDLAQRLSDLEMTWLLYFAGAATDRDVIGSLLVRKIVAPPSRIRTADDVINMQVPQHDLVEMTYTRWTLWIVSKVQPNRPHKSPPQTQLPAYRKF